MAGTEPQTGQHKSSIIELLKNPRTETGGTGKGSAGPSTAEEGRRGQEGRTETEAKPLGPTVVEVPEPKKKKASRKKAEQAQQVDTGAIQAFLIMIFEFVAMRLGPHWKISQQEAEKISEPLGRILARMEKTAVVNENMDYIMLFSAVVMVIFPRILVHKQISTQKRRKEVVLVEGKTNGSGGGTAGQQSIQNTHTTTVTHSPVKAIIEQYIE